LPQYQPECPTPTAAEPPDGIKAGVIDAAAMTHAAIREYLMTLLSVVRVGIEM